MSDSTVIKRSPDDLDWGTTIVLNVILVILGVGMCFCLKRANRLIPNRFSFPLVDRRGPHHLGDEEDGLLVHYNDEEEQDAELFDDQERLVSNSRVQARTQTQQHEDNHQDEEEEEEGYGDSQPRQAKKPTMFGIGDEDDEDDEEPNRDPPLK